MIFSEDTKSFSLTGTALKLFSGLNKGLWLVLVGVNETPPHIALISNGRYYSLSAKKVDCGTSLERLTGVLEHKQVPTLFIEIGTETNETVLQTIYKDLQLLWDNKTTCLSPIKKFFTQNISAEFGAIHYVFELLALAEKKDLLKECVSFYCKTANSKSITLPKYTQVEIRNRIQELSLKTHANQ